MTHYVYDQLKNGMCKISFSLKNCLFICALLTFFALPVNANESTTQGGGAAESSPPELTPEMQQLVSNHQACVKQVMSSFDTSAAVKRAQIVENCQSQRDTLVNAFPEEVRQLIGTNIDRRIEQVLYALEQIESTSQEATEDVQEIVEELDDIAESAEE